MTRIISIVGGLQPSTPTIGTATAGDTTASVAFTPSTYIGKGTITYTATSSPGGLTGTASSSPITVTGLTNGTAYTFTVTGTTNYGVTSIASASSNSITPALGDTGSMFPIGAVTVGSAGAASITFSSIPQTYTHLQIRAYQRAAGAGDFNFRINGDSGSNYTRHYLYGTGSGSAASGGTGSQTEGYIGHNPTATQYQASIIDILDYKNTNKNKTVKSILGTDVNGSGYILATSSAWLSTVAVNSISFTSGGGNFAQFSQFSLYGIKGA